MAKQAKEAQLYLKWVGLMLYELYLNYKKGLAYGYDSSFHKLKTSGYLLSPRVPVA